MSARRVAFPVPTAGRCAAVAAIAGLALVGLPTAARAHGGFEDLGSPSPIYARHWYVPFGLHAQWGSQGGQVIGDAGIEVSALRFLDASGSLWRLVGVGMLAQVDVGFDYSSSAHTRLALGAELTWCMFGVQTGVVYRGGVADRRNSIGWFGGAFITIGIMSGGMFVEVPTPTLDPRLHLDVIVGGMFTFKYPWDRGERERRPR